MSRAKRFRMGSIQVTAMLAALLLSAGLVLRISATLSPVAPETRTDMAAGRAIQLRDTANGVTMFQGVSLAPGDDEKRCITVSATGTRTPDEVRMLVTSSFDQGVGRWLHLDITQGTGTLGAMNCDGFVPNRVVMRGTAGDIISALKGGMPWRPDEDETIPGGHATTYRFTATLDDEAPNSVMGARLGFDLEWASEFDRTSEGFFAGSVALAVRFTEDSMIPMLVVLSLAILFIGVQNRLDGSTPQLSEAALTDEFIVFTDD